MWLVVAGIGLLIGSLLGIAEGMMSDRMSGFAISFIEVALVIMLVVHFFNTGMLNTESFQPNGSGTMEPFAMTLATLFAYVIGKLIGEGIANFRQSKPQTLTS